MTNRQWLIWQLIDMSDDDFVNFLSYSGWFCSKYCKSNQCDDMCYDRVVDWINKEHSENGDSNE
jgi:hypothetical protein